MTYSLSHKEFELMQKYIEDQCGIQLGREKAYLIESRLSGILLESGLSSFEDFYHMLNSQKDPKVIERVIDAITTNETLWFRDQTPWLTLENVLLPEYIKQIREGKRKRVRIWSAGCSTGQEPYSTAICIDRYLSRRGIRDISPNQFEILGTDISHSVLDIAKAGKYDKIAIMRGLDTEYRNKYFTNESGIWTLSREVRDRVKYRPFNLQNSFITLGEFDIVFCRYVTIYFSAELKKDIFQKIVGVLNKSQGVLFLGSSEVFSNYADDYIRLEDQGGIYYKVKGMN